MPKITINKENYLVVPSKTKFKKYDVYKKGKFLLSFGDVNYQQYHDKFGYFKILDHNDEKRRKNYRERHKNDKINNPDYAGYWSYNYLW